MVFSPQVYRARRKKLCRQLDKESVLIIPSWPGLARPGFTDTLYRASSDMSYFTGFEEAGSCLVLQNQDCFLFVQPKNPVREQWEGEIWGPEKTSSALGFDTCYKVSQFSSLLSHVLKDKNSLYYRWGINPVWDQEIRCVLNKKSTRGRMYPSLYDSFKLTAPLRMVKSSEEISYIKKSVNIAALAHRAVMRHTALAKNERELYGRFLFEILKQGAERESYTGIFASGFNACTLHYTKNNKALNPGELLLVDAGAEYKNYCSDITRTFPVSGRFSKTQKRIYNKLLKAQKTLIQSVQVGVKLKGLQQKAEKLLAQIMLEEGWLKGSLKEVLKTGRHKKYFPHGLGHSLGLDVHDPVFSEEPDFLLPEGFVMTVEPGLYLPLQDSSLKAGDRGLGLRIEDDVLVTKKGPEILSDKAPREVEEIEDLLHSPAVKSEA